MIEKIEGFDINFNENTSRIIDIDIKEEILINLFFLLINLILLLLNINLYKIYNCKKFR